MLLFEAFAVIHLGDMEARYKELTKYYELTNYIANEREDFSRPVSYTHLSASLTAASRFPNPCSKAAKSITSPEAPQPKQ